MTTDLNRQIATLNRQGLSDTEIGRIVGLSRKAVSARRIAMGLGPRGQKEADWSPEDLATMHAMVKDNKTDREIAEAIGRTAYAVEKKRVNLGWHRPPKQNPTPAAKVFHAPTTQEDRDRVACVLHLTDLMAEYGGGTIGEAKRIYRERNELDIPHERQALTATQTTRFVGSACSSSAGWL